MAIIKCPECGREVSTLAVSCPHCGAPIRERFSNAAAQSQNADEEQTQYTNQQGGASNQQPNQNRPGSPNRSKTPNNPNKRNRIIIACLIGLIIIIGGGTFLYLHTQNNRQEQADYNMLMDNFSVADAETFLLKYPNTSHAEEIKNEIGRYKRYEQEWNLIANSTNKNDFAQFRSRFPDSPFDQRACDKIDSLDWVSAMRSGTEEALQNYLNMHPDGKYSDEAQDAKQALLDAKPSAEEQDAISTNITKYFIALSDNSKEDLASITTEAVYQKSCEFIDGRNLTQIVNYNISSPIRAEKQQGSDGQSYSASCTVSRVSTDAEGNTTTKNFTARATLNQQMQISSVNLHAFGQ